MEDYAIEVKNVSLEFCLYSENVSSIKEYFIKKVKREISKDSFWALKDISFKVDDHDKIAIIDYIEILIGFNKIRRLKLQ